MYDLLERASGTKQDFRPFWVQLTAYDGSKYYTWKEQQFNPSTGGLVDLEGGRFGDNTTNPVFDPNNTVFTLPIFVRVALDNYDPTVDWRYGIVGSAGGSGASLTDEYDDGSVIFNNVTTQLWELSDFVLTGIEVATLSITGNPTGGSFQLFVSSDTGVHIVTVNWNQSAASLKTALTGTITSGEVLIVTGGNLPGTAISIAIQATLSLGANNLTGGINPTPKLTGTNQPKFNTRGLTVARNRPMSVV